MGWCKYEKEEGKVVGEAIGRPDTFPVFEFAFKYANMLANSKRVQTISFPIPNEMVHETKVEITKKLPFTLPDQFRINTGTNKVSKILKSKADKIKEKNKEFEQKYGQYKDPYSLDHELPSLKKSQIYEVRKQNIINAKLKEKAELKKRSRE